jgi:hypothetical protein
MFQHDQVFTKTAVAQQSIQTCDNIFLRKYLFDSRNNNEQRNKKFFWTKHQRELIEKDRKRVILTSSYGTGKTLVMKAKAHELGRKRQILSWKKQIDDRNDIDPGKTFIVIFSKPDALLFHSIRQEFEQLKDHVEVKNFQCKLLL